MSRSSEARVTLESHGQKTKHRHHRTTPITCSGFHFVCILKSCCELNPSQTLYNDLYRDQVHIYPNHSTQ